MKALLTGAWFDIGPTETPKGLKGPALTMRPSSPFYDADEWVVTNPRSKAVGEVQMLIANSDVGGYDKFLKLMEKETGLDIIQFDTHYTLQVQVDVTECTKTIRQIQKLLEAFVDRHFTAYIPGTLA